MRYPKLRELKEAVKALIKGPYTSKFPFQPHKPFEGFRGKPQFFEKDCVGCTACVNVCPSGALSFEDRVENGKGSRLLTRRLDICIFCGQCQANCLTGEGIKLTQEFDLAILGKRDELAETIEKELVLCAGCLEIIAPADQIKWVAKKLGPLTFSNASLMLYYLAEKGLSYINSFLSKETSASRKDRIKLLCPKCRRLAVIKS
ncbi:MAG: 4Fe-4S dicluster domain-containing protein [Candidatus Omnitrophota bacterium]|nr:4Fe-4S dicluster domain-containing protein [Candidatus Omnitrophota bacterium]